MDLAAPTTPVPVTPANPVWAIIEKADGPHLCQIRDYRNPVLAAEADYGLLHYLDGGTPRALAAGAIRALCVSRDGVAYFTADRAVALGAATLLRPFFRLDLSALQLGDAVRATCLGDLHPALRNMLGTVDPDDLVTGLTLSPSGTLYGVVREGAASGPGSEDYLFRFTQTASAIAAGPVALTPVGRTVSAAGASTHTEDLAFAPDGALYASDSASGGIHRLDPATGAVVSTFSMEPGGDYRALSVDPLDNRLVACSHAGSDAHSLILVSGGSGNDGDLVDLTALFGSPAAEAISFVQGPFNGNAEVPDIYAADGTETIYGLDFDTGATMAVTDAPWRVRALGFDYARRELYYLQDDDRTMLLGSYNVLTGAHTARGSLADTRHSYTPRDVPDNLCFYSGSLWYVAPRSDNLVRITLDASGNMTGAATAAHLTNNAMRFDLIGDLAVNPDGWMYFSCVRSDGQRFCRYRISQLNSYQVLSGPVLPTAVTSDLDYQEKWFDALAFRTPDANGNRPLYATYANTPSPLRIVSTADGSSALDKPTLPALRIIDFSEFHPGVIAGPSAKHDVMLAFSNLRLGYTYAELGGPLVPGVVPAPALATPPSVYLVNSRELPPRVQNSSYFQVKWTQNGQNPKTATAGVTTGPAFTTAMPAMPVPIGYALWAGRTSLPLRAIGVSQRPAEMNDSALLAADPIIFQSELRAPLLTEITSDPTRSQVAISANTAPGDTPPGTRIYFTLDGTDPGIVTDASGLQQPVTGTLYTGTITIPPALKVAEVEIRARVYPPTGLGAWFTASAESYLELPANYQPRLDFTNLKPSYTYAEVGGPFVAGGSPAPATAPAPAVTLLNPSEIPTAAQNSDTFIVKWTHNGGNPLTSPTGVTTGPNFTGGMPNMPVAINFAQWTGRTSLSLRAAAASRNLNVMNDSDVTADEVRILKTQLRNPVITTLRNDATERRVSIAPRTSTGDSPTGTRLYYTIDGTDPGVATGADGRQQPVTGTLYTGEIVLPAAQRFSDITVTARTYAPSAALDWFTASTLTRTTVPAVPKPKPQVDITSAKTAFTYGDVGGPFDAGTQPAPARAANPTIVLSNSASLATSLQSSTYFLVKWAYAGEDPLTATSGVTTGPAFSNGMPAMSIPIDYARWAGRTSLSLRTRAVTQRPADLDSSDLDSLDVSIQKSQLRAPIIGELVDIPAQRRAAISPATGPGDSPTGVRIYYTTNGTDPGIVTGANGYQEPATGTLYTGVITIPAALANTDIRVTARAYSPAGAKDWFLASSAVQYFMPAGAGLAGGHMDVDTSSRIYAFRSGSTDGHVHEYDKKQNVVGANFFNMLDSKLFNITQKVGTGQKFKIIVSNANLSPGGRLVINNTYNSSIPATFNAVTTYDDIALSQLPIYSLNGVAGSTQLTQFGLYFDRGAIGAGGIHPTVTGEVRSNTPGKFGEYRNGALTIQVVAVNGNGTNAFATTTATSAGGVQGVATSGLLYEATFFWHHSGPAYGN